MATKRAYVYKVPGLVDGYKVFPPVIVVEKNDKFELVNTVDDHDAFLTIPDGPFEGGAGEGRTGRTKIQIERQNAQGGRRSASNTRSRSTGRRRRGTRTR